MAMTKKTPPQPRDPSTAVDDSLPEQLMTVDQAARVARVSPRHIRRLIARDDLKVHRFGRVVRISPTDLKACAVARRA